jgi:protein-tyrosine-phosphatase
MTNNTLFVCTGNAIRSVMAEQIYNQFYPDVQTRSRGTGPAWWGIEGLDERVEKALASIGIAPQPHTSTELTDDDWEWADIIYAMQNYHVNVLTNLGCPYEKIICLNIDDPANTGDYEDYRRCAESLLLILKDEIPED